MLDCDDPKQTPRAHHLLTRLCQWSIASRGEAHLQRLQVFWQYPSGYVALPLIMKTAQHLPKPACVEQGVWCHILHGGLCAGQWISIEARQDSVMLCCRQKNHGPARLASVAPAARSCGYRGLAQRPNRYRWTLPAPRCPPSAATGVLQMVSE